MFGFYIHILHTRRIAKNHFLAVATISLFIFCTVHLALLLASTAFFNESDEASVVRSKPHSHGSFTAFNLNRVTNVIYVTSKCVSASEVCRRSTRSLSWSVIADSIFVSLSGQIAFARSLMVAQIFRCYAIWNFQRKVIIFPMLFTLSTAGELGSPEEGSVLIYCSSFRLFRFRPHNQDFKSLI